MKTVTTFLALMLCTALSLRAQLVADGATNMLSNVTNIFNGDVTVGTNGSFTLLVLANNALLTNSVRGLIGHNTTAKSNEVRLVSPSARWLMGNHLFVGSNGAMSRLVVSNGARVENFDGILASSLASSNNVALVTGSGTVWSNRGDLTVGFSGRDNQLIVSNGGFVFNRFGYLGRQPGSSNNIARVSGSGSVWSNQFYLTVGGNDRSNRLIVEAGGLVTCSDGIVSGSISSGNNEVLVTGPGSLWSNRFFLFLGDVAGRNRLVVSNGATVWSGGGILGTLSPAVSNHVIVTGLGSVWTNESSLSLGDSSPGNLVEVSAGGRLASADGFVGLNAGANNNTVLLTGGGSTWNNLASLTVGNNGSGNVLIASNGASVFSETGGVIGLNSTAISNAAIVTDLGSRWMGGVQSDFYIGSNSPFNQLIITNGGMVAGNGGYLGHELLGRSNLVLVTGAGSLWSNRSSILEMGQRGSGNRLVISNGGSVFASFIRLGRISTGVNNEVVVTGPGSSLIASFSSLRVGETGSGNRVEVNNGGTVLTQFGEIGADSGSNNQAVVTGPGSVWTNAETFVVGRYGNRNRLIVSNAATIFIGERLNIGEQTIGTNNQVVVDGGVLRVTNGLGDAILEVRRGTNQLNAGLMDVDQLLITNTLGKMRFNGGTLITRGVFIRNGENFVVGEAGPNPAIWNVRAGLASTFLDEAIIVGGSTSFNQLILTNGNVLTNSGYADLGQNFGANSNSVVVAGAGSQWLLGDGIIVGESGSDNRLVASNGAALVTASISYLGFDPGSSNNEAIVAGPGTSWNSDTNYGFEVGYQGHDNRLRITDGALVNSGPSIIGEFAASSSNLVLVSDAGTLWNYHRFLRVGQAGSLNRLVITNGGQVTGPDGIIGFASSARSNSVTVTGPGSSWLLHSNIYVGSNGSFNLLVISNTARVVNSNAFVGFNVSSSNNTALISGAGSVWSNRQTLVVGQFGSGNRVVITNGARLDNRFCTLGANASASNNVLVVTGPGSFWGVEQSFTLGNFGGGNQLVITNGGRVRGSGTIGGFSANNEVVVTGAGSTWTNASNLNVGSVGSGNRLIIRDGGEVVEQPFDVILGVGSQSTNNRVVVDGGTLRIVNSFSALDVRRGTNVLNAGLIDTGRLLVTNTLGFFEFNGGTLSAGAATVANGALFTVGNGSSAAVYNMAGTTNTHSFASGMRVANNGVLTGNGNLNTVLTVASGGTLSPGTSIGRIVLFFAPVLQGSVAMEISKTGTNLASDRVDVSVAMTYGGSLTIANLGPDALSAGDSFQLFSAPGYSGSFSSISLPALPGGLTWTNKLLVNGSIEVIAVPQPKFTSISVSGTNLIFAGTNGTAGANFAVLTATNVTTPATNWLSLVTNQFGPGGQFSFTNSINPTEPQRYFRLRIP